MAIKYKLPPLDGQKSYWGKAIVIEEDDGSKYLFSYNLLICTIDANNGVRINTYVPLWNSKTSLKHLKSFLRRFNHPIGSSAVLKKMYS